jgi:Fe2+ transport system protein FeoA
MVESLDVYQDESRRRLYHIGFLTGYLAKVLERDPFLLREFEEQIEALKEDKK